MGACISAQGGISEEEKAKHREAERQLREAKVKLDNQVKVCIIRPFLHLRFNPTFDLLRMFRFSYWARVTLESPQSSK